MSAEYTNLVFTINRHGSTVGRSKSVKRNEQVKSPSRGVSAPCRRACARGPSSRGPRDAPPPCGRTCSRAAPAGGEADRTRSLTDTQSKLNVRQSVEQQQVKLLNIHSIYQYSDIF